MLFGLVSGKRAVVVDGVEILLALLGGGIALLVERILDRGIARFTSTWQTVILSTEINIENILGK